MKLAATRCGRGCVAIGLTDDAQRLESEDLYLARLAVDALAEIEAGVPTVPWSEVRGEVQRDQ